MKRKEITDMLTDEIMADVDEREHAAKEITDYFEAKFMHIRDLLDIDSLDDLSGIKEAYEAAKDLCDDLY